MAEDRIALFIDVDNVLILAQDSGLPFNLSLIIDRVRQHGTIMSSKAYADWTSAFLRPVLGDFRANAIELIQLPTSAAQFRSERKNTADIQLAVDALEMALSPVAPNSVVIVGGDRDFVPLVQKLKRYGIHVLGIGVQAGVSRVLIEACDSFVFYDDLVPSDETERLERGPDRRQAYVLMRRAVEALQRQGRPGTGALTLEMMGQLDPAFDLTRYNTSVAELARGAQEAGLVGVVESAGPDIMLAVDSPSSTPIASPAYPAPREYDYSSLAAATASYRTILQENRIPLLQWPYRKMFIEHLWGQFEYNDAWGLSFNSMGDELASLAHSQGIRLHQQHIRKLLYTLNFANCFTTIRGAHRGHLIQIPDQLDERIYSAVPREEAISRLHHQYISLLAHNRATLHPDAVFEFLYENHVVDTEEAAALREEVTAMCEQIQPGNQVMTAYRTSSLA